MLALANAISDGPTFANGITKTQLDQEWSMSLNQAIESEAQAQALRRGRTTTYGFLVRNFANPFFLDVLSGAEEVAEEAGATVLILDSRYSLEREAMHVREIAGQRLAGLAIAPVGNGERPIGEIAKRADQRAAPTGRDLDQSAEHRIDPVNDRADSPEVGRQGRG